MSEVACSTVQDKIIGEFLKNTIEEHLLLEFTFEAVLKKLLCEPSRSQQATPKTNEPESNNAIEL
jgi:hypothetical protein